ncbi:DUF4190 domain-containing protein [Microbacterium sp. ZW T5_45]|uniref:DUF4190 domain-containing protein n=1 Tax=Microbacterium sp. ZW T5_45 TaxID=3378080 RepID=UPI0038545E8F
MNDDTPQNDDVVPAPPPSPYLPPIAQPPAPALPAGDVAPSRAPVPYDQTQHGRAPYGQTPYGQAPYGQAPYGQAPYGLAPYGQAPYGAYTPAPLPRSGAAVASLVCGIIGLLGFWFWVPGILSVVAIVSGHAAVKSTRRDPNLGGRGMAFAGLIMGYVGAGLVIVQILFFVGSLLLFGAFVPAIINR